MSTLHIPQWYLTKEEILDNHRSVLYSFGIPSKDVEPLSKLLTCILSAVKTELQSYCDTSYSRGDVNQMWILKNSTDLLGYIQSRSLSSCNSIKIFDFSTLYIALPHSKLKEKLRELVQLCFLKGMANVDTHTLGRDRSSLVKATLILPKGLWNWYHQHVWVFDWQHICYLWWTCFSIVSGDFLDRGLLLTR